MANKLTTDEARELADMRPEREKVCPVCGTTFMAIGRGRYCDDPCKYRAYQRRKKGRPEADKDNVGSRPDLPAAVVSAA